MTRLQLLRDAATAQRSERLSRGLAGSALVSPADVLRDVLVIALVLLGLLVALGGVSVLRLARGRVGRPGRVSDV